MPRDDASPDAFLRRGARLEDDPFRFEDRVRRFPALRALPRPRDVHERVLRVEVLVVVAAEGQRTLASRTVRGVRPSPVLPSLLPSVAVRPRRRRAAVAIGAGPASEATRHSSRALLSLPLRRRRDPRTGSRRSRARIPRATLCPQSGALRTCLLPRVPRQEKESTLLRVCDPRKSIDSRSAKGAKRRTSRRLQRLKTGASVRQIIFQKFSTGGRGRQGVGVK